MLNATPRDGNGAIIDQGYLESVNFIAELQRAKLVGGRNEDGGDMVLAVPRNRDQLELRRCRLRGGALTLWWIGWWRRWSRIPELCQKGSLIDR